MKSLGLFLGVVASAGLLCCGAENSAAPATSGTPVPPAVARPDSAPAEPAKDTNAPPALKLVTQSVNPPGIAYGTPGIDVLLKLNEQKPALGFYVPSGWHLLSANTNNSFFVITKERVPGNITVGVELNQDNFVTPFNLDNVRKLVLDRFKNSRITEEGGSGALGADGFFYDLVQTVGGETWVVYVIVVDSTLGQLQLSMQVPKEKAAEMQPTFLRIKSTLRLVTREEQLHPPPPPKSLAL